jgi:AcrR family transcriptional regulator
MGAFGHRPAETPSPCCPRCRPRDFVVTKQARSENTRLHLVRSAAELFDRNGFAGATLEDVSRAAGVTKGAFYFHFSSKDELGGAIQDEACELLRAAVYRLVGDRRAERGNSIQSLVDLTHQLVRWLEREPLVRASFRTARECGHRGKPFLGFYTDWHTVTETLLLAAERAGDLRPGVVVEQALTLVLTVSAGVEMAWWAGIRDGSMAESLTGMWSLVLPGLVVADRLSGIDPSGTV